MGRKSSIARLQPEVRAHIEAQLAQGSCTLDELIADLQARWPSHDRPSRSAVHRYGQKLERRLSAIRASTEAAKLAALPNKGGVTDDTKAAIRLALGITA